MLVKSRFQMNIRMIVALVVAIVLLAVAQSSTAQAQAANTLKVSPVRTDIEIKPGETKTVQTTVTNLTDAEVSVRPTTNDFVSGDESGTPALILDDNKYAPTRSLKRFMSPLENVTIPARESKIVNVIITVPSDAQAGGYFGAVRFAPSSPDSGGQVNLSASVASLILLTVPGDIVEKLELTSFGVQQDGKSNTFFTTPSGLQTTFRFVNKGNVQVGPFGKITVKQGDKVVYETDFNNRDPREVVLPDSARVWNVPLEKIGSFGHYTVLATFTYGQKNQTVEVSQAFWVVPPIVIIAAIVLLLVIAGAIVGTILLVRRSKRRHRIASSYGRGSHRR